MTQHCPVQELCTGIVLGAIGSMAVKALVREAQHTEVVYAVLHTEVEKEAVVAEEPAVVDVVNPVAACYDATPVPVGKEFLSHDSSHSILALPLWHDCRRWSRAQ
jgi:hypothetical protein